MLLPSQNPRWHHVKMFRNMVASSSLAGAAHSLCAAVLSDLRSAPASQQALLSLAGCSSWPSVRRATGPAAAAIENPAAAWSVPFQSFTRGYAASGMPSPKKLDDIVNLEKFESLTPEQCTELWMEVLHR